MAQRQLYSGLDLYDWRGTGPNGRTKAVDVDKWQQNQEDIRHLPGAFPVQSVVITDGQITPTAAALSVDTEGGAPADDLTAIAPGDLHAGMLLALCSVDAGRKVTIKNSAGASGIQTLDGKDVVLDTQYAVMLRMVSTESLTLWREEPGPLRLQLTVSTSDTLGGVKIGPGITIAPDGTISIPTPDDDFFRIIEGEQRILSLSAALASELAEQKALRLRDIGCPRWWRSTNLPPNHAWINGDFIAFQDWPEFHEVYTQGGFDGMVMPWDADEEHQAAHLGQFRPDSANPTGLFLPMDGGQFFRNWGPGSKGDPGNWYSDNIRAHIHTFGQLLTSGGGANYGSPTSQLWLERTGDAAKTASYGGEETVPQHIWHPLCLYLGRPA